MIELLKKKKFYLTKEAWANFNGLQVTCYSSVLQLPDFSQFFELECDASSVRIRTMLSQNRRPIAFFWEKLNEYRRKYSTYDKECYTIVKALEYFSHYLLSNKFILFTEHETLKFLNNKSKLKRHHDTWVEFLSTFYFVLKHKEGSQNKVVDGLSYQNSLLIALQAKVVRFDVLQSLYHTSENFRDIWENYWSTPTYQYQISNGSSKGVVYVYIDVP